MHVKRTLQAKQFVSRVLHVRDDYNVMSVAQCAVVHPVNFTLTQLLTIGAHFAF